MKSVRFALVFLFALALRGADKAPEPDFPKHCVIRAPDGRSAAFVVWMALPEGLRVNREDESIHAPVMVLKWTQIDLAYLKDKYPRLHEFYTMREQLLPGNDLGKYAEGAPSPSAPAPWAQAKGKSGTTAKAKSAAEAKPKPGAPAEVTGRSEPPIPPLALSLDVQLIQLAGGSSGGKSWETTWGSYEKSFSAQRGLEIKTRLMGNYDRNVTVAWVFVAQRVSGRGLYAYDQGSQEVTLRVPQHTIGVIGKPISGSDAKYVALGQRDQSGGKPFGYAVVVKQNGKVIASMESSKGLLDMIPR